MKPLNFEFMNLWKSNQEKEMLLQKRNALKDENYLIFRECNVSIHIEVLIILIHMPVIN